MDLLKEIKSYTYEQILAIEESDRQFLALKKTYNNIIQSNKQSKNPYDKLIIDEIFLLFVVQNALISYQIAGSGELRWEEFGQKLETDFRTLVQSFLVGNYSFDRWYNLMTNSRWNKRLYNLKLNRIKKFWSKEWKGMYDYYKNMEYLLDELSVVMKMKKHKKTMLFAVKIFGYAARVVYDEFISYPMNIGIPVDSRIRTIYKNFGEFEKDNGEVSDQYIQDKFQDISDSMGVPPLHLDSLLWIKIWDKIKLR